MGERDIREERQGGGVWVTRWGGGGKSGSNLRYVPRKTAKWFCGNSRPRRRFFFLQEVFLILVFFIFLFLCTALVSGVHYVHV
jgi:hypothetical protein